MTLKIESWRRRYKWSAQRITHELAELCYTVNRRTVTRHLTKLALGHRRFLDPCGDSNREPGKITARVTSPASSATEPDTRGPSPTRPATTGRWNYHRPHSGTGGLPPSARLKNGVTNVQPSYT